MINHQITDPPIPPDPPPPPPPPPPPAKPIKKLWVSAYDLFGATGDKAKFIEAVAASGASGIRIFYLYAWGQNVASPWKQIGTWKAGYADAADLPFYDLDKENLKYWQVFRSVHQKMKDNGLMVHGVLHDFCSLKSAGWPKYYHPILSSRPDRDPNDPTVNRLPGGFWAMEPNTIKPYQKKWFDRIVKELNQVGIEYYLEPMNEADALDQTEEYFIGWHQWVVNVLRSRGVKKNRIIASSMRAWRAIADQVGVYSLHGCVRPELVPNWSYDHNRILISGDGGFTGSGGADAVGRKGLGVNDAEAMAQKILSYNYWGYEYLSRGMYLRDNDRMNADDFDPEPVKRMIRPFKQ